MNVTAARRKAGLKQARKVAANIDLWSFADAARKRIHTTKPHARLSCGSVDRGAEGMINERRVCGAY